MGRGFGDFNALTDAFMAAAMNSSRWDAAMDVAAEATGSFGALLLPVRGSMPLIPIGEAMRPTMDIYFRDGWAGRYERFRSLPTFLRRGVAAEFDFTTEAEIARSPYYQELLRPQGLKWFAGVKVGDDSDVWGLMIQRTPAQGPFSPAELASLAKLSRSLASAAELAQAFGFARMEAALAAFEASGSPVAAIDRTGDVVRLNAAAERLLGPDLMVVRRRITSFDRDATAALDRALQRAALGAAAGSLPRGRCFAETRGAADPRLCVASFRSGARRLRGLLGLCRLRRSRRPARLSGSRPRGRLRAHPVQPNGPTSCGKGSGERPSARSRARGSRGAGRCVGGDRAQSASGRVPQVRDARRGGARRPARAAGEGKRRLKGVVYLHHDAR